VAGPFNPNLAGWKRRALIQKSSPGSSIAGLSRVLRCSFVLVENRWFRTECLCSVNCPPCTIICPAFTPPSGGRCGVQAPSTSGCLWASPPCRPHLQQMAGMKYTSHTGLKPSAVQSCPPFLLFFLMPHSPVTYLHAIRTPSSPLAGNSLRGAIVLRLMLA
jgi:hypothetical protein